MINPVNAVGVSPESREGFSQRALRVRAVRPLAVLYTCLKITGTARVVCSQQETRCAQRQQIERVSSGDSILNFARIPR